MPSEFEIHYANGKKIIIYELSRCVCNSVEVDYGGDNKHLNNLTAKGSLKYINTLTFETTVLTKAQVGEDIMAKI